MNALVMCGGQGSRLQPAIGETEKPLAAVGSQPMVDHVLTALGESSIETVFAAVSPATPETAAHLSDREAVRLIETPGEGYVDDLITALETVEPPVLTITADLPLVARDHVDRAVAVADGESLSVCVPRSLVESVGASVDTTVDHEGTPVVPTGLNVVGTGADRRVVWTAERLALNVNRPSDLQRAETMLTD